MKSLGLGFKSSLDCAVKIASPYNEVWINGMSEGNFCFWVLKHGACFTIASQFCEIEIVFYEIFLHNYDLNVNSNNFFSWKTFVPNTFGIRFAMMFLQ